MSAGLVGSLTSYPIRNTNFGDVHFRPDCRAVSVEPWSPRPRTVAMAPPGNARRISPKEYSKEHKRKKSRVGAVVAPAVLITEKLCWMEMATIRK